MMRKLYVVFLLFITAFQFGGEGYCAIYYVSESGSDYNTGTSWGSAFSTLVKAAETSVSGDSVWAAKGSYSVGDGLYIIKGVAVYGGFAGNETNLGERNCSENKTIIDGNNLELYISNLGTLDGFYITRGNICLIAIQNGILRNSQIYTNTSHSHYSIIYNDSGIVNNCGVYSNLADNTFPGIIENRGGTISDSSIYSNSSSSLGGGIENCYGTVSNCTLYSNTAYDGGGIHNYSSGIVQNCTIISNTSKAKGGGIYNEKGIVKNCKIYQNSSIESGGGIYNEGTVENSIVYSNFTESAGSGIYNTENASILNCTVFSNKLSKSSGIYNAGKVKNSIVWGNPPIDIYSYGNNKETYSCFGESGGTNGNIREVPQFANISGDISTWDFHLKNGSMCIDAGTTESIPSSDFEGNQRPGGDGKCDIGAYESQDSYLPGNPPAIIILRVSKSGNNSDGSSWANAYTTISKAIEAYAGNFTEIWIAKDNYIEGKTLTIPSIVSIYGGFAGTEITREQRDIINNQTIIDGNSAYRCILNNGIIDGLYVTKGYFSYSSYDIGSAIYNGSCGIVKNCYVYNNIQSYEQGVILNKGKIEKCYVYSNSGGGIYNRSGGTISDSDIFSNISQNHSGIYNNGTVINCAVYANRAYNWNSGIYNGGSVINCTVYANSASNTEGGIYNTSYGSVTNSIIYKNYPNDFNLNFGEISFSCFSESDGKTNGNIFGNPKFENASGDVKTWNLHLQNGSVCIDRGTTETMPLKDKDGNLRPGTDGKVDMGAYESPDDYQPGNPTIPTKILFVSKDGDNSSGISWETAFTDISSAISLGINDETFIEIWVAKGTYTQNNTVKIISRFSMYGGFEGTETSRDQRDTDTNQTIIDFSGSTYHKVDNYGIFDGFHVTKSNALGLQNNYGTVENCRIYQNSGGGITNYYGLIKNSEIYSNSSANNYSNYNAGIITNCKIYNNTGSSNYDGGGIRNYGTLSNCLIYSNSTSGNGGGVYNGRTVSNCKVYSNYSGYGGGIYNDYGDVENTLIYSNTSFASGAGVYNSGGYLTNCVIYSNSSNSQSGGVYNKSGEIINCTVYSNSASSNPGGIFMQAGKVTNSIVWKNSFQDIDGVLSGKMFYTCIGESDGKDGNIKVVPYFISSKDSGKDYDFHLQKGSMCIGAGTLAGIPSYDIEGNPRPGADGKVDMGAYESPDGYSTGTLTNITKRYYVSKTGNDSDGSSWTNAYTTIKKAVQSSYSSDYLTEIWAASGNYLENYNIFIPGTASLIGGFAGTESSISARDTANNKVIIDGENKYRCIYSYGNLDSLNITKGYSSGEGGGIRNTFGVVKNCEVYSNSGKYGGGIRNNFGSISNCIVYSNTSDSGGGIYNYNGDLEQCSVYSNTSTTDGGGIFIEYGTMKNCTAYTNAAAKEGGGIKNHYSTVDNCVLYSNSASGNGGGGISNYYGTISNSRIFLNSSSYGGGVKNIKQSASSNCIVYSNSGNNGSGIFNDESNIMNCTVSGNSYGDGINSLSGIIINTIAWNNSAADIKAGSSNIRYSCFKESTVTNNNISFNPLFMNTSGDILTYDFHLQNNSPCIDSGIAQFGVLAMPEEDYEGMHRPQGAGYDMGAFEHEIFPGDINMDSVIDTLDIDILKNYLIGKAALSEAQKNLSDINHDNKLDLSDIVSLINLIRE